MTYLQFILANTQIDLLIIFEIILLIIINYYANNS